MIDTLVGAANTPTSDPTASLLSGPISAINLPYVSGSPIVHGQI
jgi:hypothetical protein